MAYKICEKCGETNKENAVICVCGTSLVNVEVQGTKETDKKYAEFQSPPSFRICPYCEEKVSGDSFTCKNCGNVITKFRRIPISSYTDDVDDTIKILLYIVTFLFPVVGLIVGGIYTVSESYSKQSFGKGLLVFGLVLMLIGFVIFVLFGLIGGALIRR